MWAKAASKCAGLYFADVTGHTNGAGVLLATKGPAWAEAEACKMRPQRLENPETFILLSGLLSAACDADRLL